MSKPLVRIHNTETDEVIDREMTDNEFKIYESNAKKQEEYEKVQAKEENNKLIAQSKLEALGISLDDLKALGIL
jgi:hypothetical protein